MVDSSAASVASLARAVAAPAPRFLTASLALELGIAVTLSVLFPVMIHLLPVPEDARLGPRLIPMFYAPLLTVLLGRMQTAVVVALLAPWLNWALTGHPTPPSACVTMVQLLGFVCGLRLMVRRWGAQWFFAAPAYLVGMLASALVAAAAPGMIGGQSAAGWVVHSVTLALPGCAVLLGLNWFAVRNYPTGGGGNGPVAA